MNDKPFESRKLEDIAQETAAHEETRGIGTLEFLNYLVTLPSTEVYEFFLQRKPEHIDRFLDRFPDMGRDRQTAYDALHAVLDTLHRTAPYATDQDLKLSSANSAQKVLAMVTASIANKRASEREHGYLVQQWKKEQELKKTYRELAYTDDLTHCYNQRFLRMQLNEDMKQATNYRRPFSIALFDVDHFKGINDEHGHPAGDAVLKALADRVRSIKIRQQADTFGRYGGEEFMILLPETTEEQAALAAEKIRHGVEEQSFVYEKENIAAKNIPVTISIGVKQYDPQDSYDVVTLVDNCMYAAKRLGRNRVMTESGLRKFLRETPIARAELQQMLKLSDKLYEYYQNDPPTESLKITPSSEGGTA